MNRRELFKMVAGAAVVAALPPVPTRSFTGTRADLIIMDDLAPKVAELYDAGLWRAAMQQAYVLPSWVRQYVEHDGSIAAEILDPRDVFLNA